MAIIAQLVNIAKENWHNPIGLFIAIAIIFIGGILTFANIDLSAIPPFGWIVISGLIIIITLTWLSSNSLPKVKKGMVGFAISIASENKEEFIRLKSDFIETIKNLCNNSSYHYQFQVIILSNHLSSKIEDRESAMKYHKKMKTHFFIYGKCKVRYNNGKETYILDLNALVRHFQVEESIQQKITKEFSELFPKRLKIPKDNELTSFEISANIIEIVSKYIIGLASLISMDYNYSKELFESIENVLSKQTELLKIPSIAKIKQRIPDRLFAIHYSLANIYYSTFRKNKCIEDLYKMGEHLEKLSLLKPDDYSSHLLRAIYYFLNGRDILKSRREIDFCIGNKDQAWRLSSAFLHAYEGNIIKANKDYMRAYNKVDIRAAFDIEQFIVDILEQEPDRIQLYFCLGIINLYEKGDYISAETDFLTFGGIVPEEQKEIHDMLNRHLGIIYQRKELAS